MNSQNNARRHARYIRLVMPYRASLLAFAMRLARHPDNAQDLLQDTLMRAWRGFDGLQYEAATWLWLRRILLNEHLRQQAKQRTEQVPFDENNVTLPCIADTQLMAHRVRQQIAALPSHYQQVARLQWEDGYSSTEIARMLAMNPNSVMTRIHRAKHQLRKVLVEI